MPSHSGGTTSSVSVTPARRACTGFGVEPPIGIGDDQEPVSVDIESALGADTLMQAAKRRSRMPLP